MWWGGEVVTGRIARCGYSGGGDGGDWLRRVDAISRGLQQGEWAGARSRRATVLHTHTAGVAHALIGRDPALTSPPTKLDIGGGGVDAPADDRVHDDDPPCCVRASEHLSRHNYLGYSSSRSVSLATYAYVHTFFFDIFFPRLLVSYIYT